jgi:hypothetical protein
LLLLGQRTALRYADQLGDLIFVLAVGLLLRFAQRDEILPVRALGQFRFHLGLAAAQHQRGHAITKFREIVEFRRAPALIELIKFAVESEERSEHFRIEKIDNGIEFVDAVFDRRAGEDKSVTAAQSLNRLGCLGVPVFDALRFIKHHDVGLEVQVHVKRIAEHLLVVDQGEKRRMDISRQAHAARPENELIGQRGEAANLFLPLGLKRRWSND